VEVLSARIAAAVCPVYVAASYNSLGHFAGAPLAMMVMKGQPSQILVMSKAK